MRHVLIRDQGIVEAFIWGPNWTLQDELTIYKRTYEGIRGES